MQNLKDYSSHAPEPAHGVRSELCSPVVLAVTSLSPCCSSVTHSQLSTSSHWTAAGAFLSFWTPHQYSGSPSHCWIHPISEMQRWGYGILPAIPVKYPWCHLACRAQYLDFLGSTLSRSSQCICRTPWQTMAHKHSGGQSCDQLGSPSKKTMTCFSSSITRCSMPTPTTPFLKASLVISSSPFPGLHFFTSCGA